MKLNPEEEVVDTKEPRLHHKIEISKLRVQHCFGMSKMTVVDDNCNNRKCFYLVTYLESYFKLKYIEFLEFLCRLAHSAKLTEVWMQNGQ
jgi:hypothetical protein